MRWLADVTGRFGRRSVFLGVLVIGAPSAVSFFPNEWGDFPLWLRGATFAAWLFAAFAFVASAVSHEASVRDATTSLFKWRQQTADRAEYTIFEGLLSQEPRFGQDFAFTVYVYNAQSEMLEPVWPSKERDAQWQVKCFRSGHGATGLAWDNAATVVKHGAEVHNDVHGLTEEQQAAFAEYNLVAATRIYDDTQDPIGVLSCVSRKDSEHFGTVEGRAVLRETADAIGVVLQRVNGL